MRNLYNTSNTSAIHAIWWTTHPAERYSRVCVEHRISDSIQIMDLESDRKKARERMDFYVRNFYKEMELSEENCVEELEAESNDSSKVFLLIRNERDTYWF